MKEKKIFKNKGFMAVEILIAASIISVSILAMMAVAEKSIYINRQALHSAQAAFLLEEGAEAMRIIRDNEWSGISSLPFETDYYPVFSAGNWILLSDVNTVDIFTRKIQVDRVYRDSVTKDISDSGIEDGEARLVTVTVSWPEGGKTITKTLQFYLMNIF